MAYDSAHAFQSYYGHKEDVGIDPSAGLLPLTSSLIPPLVAQAFGLPTFGNAAQPPPPHPPAPQQSHQSILNGVANSAVLGALGFGGPQYPSAIQQAQLAGLPLGYLQSLAAAGQQQQQQQQQQSAAALLAQTAGALQAHTAALAAAARSAPTSSGPSQQYQAASSAAEYSNHAASSLRAAAAEVERRNFSAATTSSALSSGKAVPTFSNSTGSLPFQHPLLHNLYAAMAQQHSYGSQQQHSSGYGASAPASYASAMAPYASHLHAAAYYGRQDHNQAAAAAAAAAAAYGYSQPSHSAPYPSFHPGYGGSSAVDYSTLSAAYRPLGMPAAPAPSANPASQSYGGDDDSMDDGSTRAIKRPRLVWTPQLHRKFETAILKLGVDKAVPKNIMQEMNIDGLTRENVASHLQKYRMMRRKDAGTSSMSDGAREASDSRTAGSKRSEPEPTPPPMRPTPVSAAAAPSPRAHAAAAPAASGGGDRAVTGRGDAAANDRADAAPNGRA